MGQKCPLSDCDFPFLNESLDEDAAMFGLTVELLNTGAEICLFQFKVEACEVPPAEVNGLCCLSALDGSLKRLLVLTVSLRRVVSLHRDEGALEVATIVASSSASPSDSSFVC